jgi:hypothetical protein
MLDLHDSQLRLSSNLKINSVLLSLFESSGLVQDHATMISMFYAHTSPIN